MAVGLGSMDMPVPSIAKWEWLNWKFPRPVHAGDTIQVTIAETSVPGDWSIVIDNLTTGQEFTTTTPYRPIAP